MPASSRAELFLGDRADRLAGIGQCHDQPQHQRDDEHGDEGNDARHGKEGEAEVDAFEAIGDFDGAGIGTERVKERVLDEHRQPQRHQEHVAIVAMATRDR